MQSGVPRGPMSAGAQTGAGSRGECGFPGGEQPEQRGWPACVWRVRGEAGTIGVKLTRSQRLKPVCPLVRHLRGRLISRGRDRVISRFWKRIDDFACILWGSLLFLHCSDGPIVPQTEASLVAKLEVVVNCEHCRRAPVGSQVNRDNGHPTVCSYSHCCCVVVPCKCSFMGALGGSVG